MLDSLRPDFVGCYGKREVKTPALDRLTAEGVFFKNAYAESPTTIPARTALFSGIYTFTNRPWMRLRPDDAHLAEHLQANGYRTVALGDGPFHWGVPHSGIQRGFDELRSYFGKCSRPPPEYEDAEIDTSGITFLPENTEFERRIQRNSMRSRRYSLDTFGRVSVEKITDDAVEFLGSAAREPFFLWLDYFETHEPWDTPKRYTDMYGTDEAGRFVPMPPYAWADVTEADMTNLMAHYSGCVTQTDEQVGHILAKLDETGLAEDTLVTVISDHGEPLGDHGTFRKFLTPVYDELAKIVWIVRGPGIKAVGGSDALVSNVDYAPTVCRLLGIEPHERFEGRSLAPVLAGEKDGMREEIYTGAFQTRRAVRDRKWKFINNMGEKPNELFDMESDPEERENLIDREPEVASSLALRLWEFGQNWAKSLAWRDHPRE